MGSTSSNCCEVFDKDELPEEKCAEDAVVEGETSGSFSSLAKPTFSADDTAPFDANSMPDPRSPSSFIPRTPLVPLPSIVVTSEYDMTAVTSDAEEVMVTQCQVNSESSCRTPNQKPKIKVLEEEFAMIDPRSPSNVILRTPIVNKGEYETNSAQNVVDPRSPSAKIARTPIVKILDDKDLKDPRSPSTGIERTPLKLSYAESLRRTVLLTNTMTTTPATQSEDNENSALQTVDKLEINTLSPLNLSSLSCASILNVSRSSSARATCGSEDPSPNTSMEEFEFFDSPATVFGESITEEQNNALFSKDNVDEITDAVVKKLMTEILVIGEDEEITEQQNTSLAEKDAENISEILELDQVLTEFQTTDSVVMTVDKNLDIEEEKDVGKESTVSSDMSQLHGAMSEHHSLLQDTQSPQKMQEEHTLESNPTFSDLTSSLIPEENQSVKLLDSNDIKILETSMFNMSTCTYTEDQFKNDLIEISEILPCNDTVDNNLNDFVNSEKAVEVISMKEVVENIALKPLAEAPTNKDAADSKIKNKPKTRIPSVRRRSGIIKPLRTQKSTDSPTTSLDLKNQSPNNQYPSRAKKQDENTQAKQIPMKLHRHVLEKKGVQMGKQQTRSPLSILGHNNSPESRNDLNRSSNKSRVPRYRGTPISKVRSMSVASTSSLSPKLETEGSFKYGKEN